MEKFNLSIFGKLIFFSSTLGIILLTAILFSIYSYDSLKDIDNLRQFEIKTTEAFNLRAKLSRTRDTLIYEQFTEIFDFKNKDLQKIENQSNYALSKNIIDYRNLIKNYISNIKTRGVNENMGIEGTFRRAIHIMEEDFKNLNEDKLAVTLLQIRRGEKDFIMRRTPFYILRVEEQVNILKNQIIKKNYPRDINEKLNNELNIYFSNFKSLTEIFAELDRNEKRMDNLESNISESIKNLVRIKQDSTDILISFNILLYVFLIILMLILSIKLAKDITKPITILQNATNQIIQGDFSHRVPVISSDEIGRFAQSFNLMVEKVQTAYKFLELTNKNLEDIVKERTLVLENEIQERKKTEERLEVALKQIEYANSEISRSLIKERELNSLKSRFVSNVSHEFRTPLTVILTSTYLIEEFVRRTDIINIEKQLTKIRNSIDHLTTLLDDVLSLGKIESGKIKFVIEEFDFSIYINSLIDEMKTLNNKNINIHLLFSGNNYFIKNDKKILYVIFSNLISNGIKYSDPDSDLYINIDFEEEDILFTIKDFGIGIPISDQKYLFQPYHRALNVGAIQGNGLGLSIVKRYIDVMNGLVWFTSKEKQGTTFFVKLKKDLIINQNLIDTNY